MEDNKKINCADADDVNGDSNGMFDRVFCPECKEYISQYVVYDTAMPIIEQHKKDYPGHNPKYGHIRS